MVDYSTKSWTHNYEVERSRTDDIVPRNLVYTFIQMTYPTATEQG